MTNRFWVYVNEPNNKAFVHLADCSHCNDGKGRTGDKLPHNGKWLGHFDEAQALRTARASNKNTIRWCGFCAKRLGLEDTTL